MSQPQRKHPRRGVHEPDRGAPQPLTSQLGNHRPAPGPSRRSVALTLPALRPRARLPLRPTPFAPAPASACPVWLARTCTSASGGAAATIVPPPTPPSGPRSMIQSASAITSRSCSITTTLCPASTSRCSTRISFATSAMCRPTVGSSSTYSVCGAFWPRRVMSSRTFVSSVTSLMRCASPPDSVGDGWPSVRYPARHPSSAAADARCSRSARRIPPPRRSPSSARRRCSGRAT